MAAEPRRYRIKPLCRFDITAVPYRNTAQPQAEWRLRERGTDALPERWAGLFLTRINSSEISLGRSPLLLFSSRGSSQQMNRLNAQSVRDPAEHSNARALRAAKRRGAPKAAGTPIARLRTPPEVKRPVLEPGSGAQISVQRRAPRPCYSGSASVGFAISVLGSKTAALARVGTRGRPCRTPHEVRKRGTTGSSAPHWITSSARGA